LLKEDKNRELGETTAYGQEIVKANVNQKGEQPTILC
jgi:hypothetical protein